MSVKGLFFNTSRESYSPDNCYNPMTIDELIEELELIQQAHGELPIFFCNDNGYTYGSVCKGSIGVGEYIEGNGLTFYEENY